MVTQRPNSSRQVETIARLERMTGQELAHRQPLSARLLQFADRQGAVAAGDDDTGAVDAQSPPFFTGTGDRHGLPELDGLSAELRLGAGKRIEGTNMAIEFLRFLVRRENFLGPLAGPAEE